MTAAPDLAPIAALIGERARAAILAELLDGGALTATELATRAAVSPATASVHLARLVAGGLLAVEPRGRYRYFRLSSRRVARALESLAGLPVAPAAGPDGRPRAPTDLRFARACYDHLAGRLGVAVERALAGRRAIVLESSGYRVTAAGERWFLAFGVDLGAVRRVRRSFALACLDWTERRFHVAGALGEALLARLLERKWLVRRAGERVLDLTAAGRRGIARELDVKFPADGERNAFSTAPRASGRG